MNVLITGAYGFIGKRLILQLAKNGDSIVAIDHTPSQTSLPPSIYQLVIDLDQLDASTVSSLFDGKPFTLVHLAWHNPREGSYAAAAHFVTQLAKLLEMAQGRAERVISLGSADEYGTHEGCLAPESESKGQLSPYGWSKKCARELLQSWCARQKTTGFWLRPFTVYGDGQRSNMLLPYAIRQAETKQKAGFSDGLQERDFVHVDDVIEAIVLALRSNLEGFNAINLGWGQTVPIRTVLESIARIFNAEHLFEYGVIPRRADEPQKRFADLTAATKLLNWAPSITLEEGLRRIAKAHKPQASDNKRKTA